ncbi:MAG: hypothetical protein AAF968_09800 [Pseudomonadota bacterium]
MSAQARPRYTPTVFGYIGAFYIASIWIGGLLEIALQWSALTLASYLFASALWCAFDLMGLKRLLAGRLILIRSVLAALTFILVIEFVGYALPIYVFELGGTLTELGRSTLYLGVENEEVIAFFLLIAAHYAVVTAQFRKPWS